MSEVSKDSAFPRRLWHYLQERFPLVGQGLLIISYFSSNQFVALSLERPNEPVYLSPEAYLGGLMLLCIFFHLRVFDEHKDYKEDRIHYPNRILSRGIITLGELKVLGGLALAVQFLIAIWRGPATLISLSGTVLFSILMLKEFFVAEWLKKRFLLYAATHMCIMPLIALTVYSFVTQNYFWQAPVWFFLYSLVGMLVTLNWEISRKIRAPEDEIPGVDSYSTIFGPHRAAHLVLAIRLFDTGLVASLGYHLQLHPGFYLGLLLLFALTLQQYFRFTKDPSSKNAKRLETNAGIYIIGFDVILAISIAATYGIVWRN